MFNFTDPKAEACNECLRFVGHNDNCSLDYESIELPEDFEKPLVRLVGEDGNGFFIMGRVVNALKRAGAPKEYCTRVQNAMLSGNYSNLLMIAMEVTDQPELSEEY